MKEIWNDKERRKGLIGTLVFHTILVLLFLFVGLKYLDPKPSDGIVINFGNSETGMGNEADGAQAAVSEPTPETQTSEPEETTTQDQNEVLTQDVVDAPSVDDKKSNKPKAEKKPEPKKEPAKPKPSSELEKMLQSVKSSKSGGEGEKEGPGDQGDPNGDPNSPNRIGGGGGNGGGGNYMLGGRQALSKPRPKYPCTDQGRVVVKIYVNQDGKVTQAIPGERIPQGASTTTASSCLFDQAKAAAMRTTWQPDSDAPNPQIGFIVYNFQKQ